MYAPCGKNQKKTPEHCKLELALAAQFHLRRQAGDLDVSADHDQSTSIE
jgi:hypothetical protein